MSDQNAATARRVYDEVWGQGNLDLIDEVCTEDYVGHDPILGDTDREASKRAIEQYRNAFPDLKFEVDDVIADGDKVVVRWHATGTFENELMGFSPNHEPGQPIEGIGIDRFEDGKIAEAWGQWDTLQFMRDIGAIPQEAAA